MPERILGPEGVDWGVPYQLKKQTSLSEDPRPLKGVRHHISSKGVNCEIPHRLGRRTIRNLYLAYAF